MKAVPLLILVFLAACEERSSGLMNASTGGGKDDGGTPAPPDDTPAAVVDTTPAPFDPYPNDWIEAPAGYCDDIANLLEATYVIDGDTIALTTGDKVRLIGVDAPEVTKNDCWSQQSKQLLTELTPLGTTVCLEGDGAGEDNFGRLLRYVYVKRNGKWVMENARLVRLGAARAYHKFLAGKAYAPQIEAAEADAREEDLGGWSHCKDWE